MFPRRSLTTSAFLLALSGCSLDWTSATELGEPDAAFAPAAAPSGGRVRVEIEPPAASPSVDAASVEPADAGIALDSAAPATDTATPATPATDASLPPTSRTEYAPYFYAWGWNNAAYPFGSLVDMKKKAGVDAATLAFVLAGGGGCTASRTIPSHLADINAFRAAGGTLKASFGGAGGTYLESACTSATGLADALGAFIDETGLRDLDFDVEQDPAMTTTVNARRATALAKVQAEKGAKVSFTLAVNPPDASGKNGGLPGLGLAVLKSALAAGVEVSHVNLMVMDYGSTLSAGHAMGDLAIGAIEATVVQLKAMIPGLSDDKAYAMIGATPMIGQNDVKGEVFNLADAKSLVAFARSKRIGLVSFWAIQRDQPCGATIDLGVCSMPGAPSYGFHSILKGVL